MALQDSTIRAYLLDTFLLYLSVGQNVSTLSAGNARNERGKIVDGRPPGGTSATEIYRNGTARLQDRGKARKMRFNGRTNEPESGKEVYLRAFERKVDESVGRFDF